MACHGLKGTKARSGDLNAPFAPSCYIPIGAADGREPHGGLCLGGWLLVATHQRLDGQGGEGYARHTDRSANGGRIEATLF